MAKKIKALVKPALLVWGRQSAGLSLEDAASGVTKNPETLAAWEAGTASPSVPQLRKLAAKYKRPLAVFYLPAPPLDFQPLRDYRRLPGQVSGVLGARLRYEIRIAQERRNVSLDLYEEIGEEPPRFSLFTTLEAPTESLGADIRRFLGVTFENQVTWRDARTAYNTWRESIEAKGVLVFQISRVPIEEVRGLALAENVLPIIAVNAKDHVNGRTFSLLHELVHVALRQSGISDFSEFNDSDLRPSDERRIEIFCNEVAAAVLMPREIFLLEPLVAQNLGSQTWRDEDLDALARQYSVSPEAILRRLLTLKRTSQTFYKEKRKDFLARYRRLAERDKDKSGGPPPHLAALGTFGYSFARLVLQTYYERRITLSDVSGYLGLKIPYIAKLENAAYGRAA